MFRHLQELDLQTHCYYDKENDIKFSPPVYEQRYSIVAKILEDAVWDGKIRKVVEFGCAEMRFVTILKRVKGIEHIIEVDIDIEVLRGNMYKATPLVSDYLNCRLTPLRIDVYKGNVAEFDDCLREADAVIAIELIEHLFPEDLENLPYNIFGCIAPKVAVFTTPNSDFNVLLHMNTPNGFRHDDHKFEWSRKQFKDWAKNICSRYPHYEVHFVGVGRGPPGQKKYGHCSQLCIFVRKDVLEPESSEESTTYAQTPLNILNQYELINTVEYPCAKDNRTNEEKILDEFKYHLNRYQNMKDKYFNFDENIFEIPLDDFLCYISMHPEDLKQLLEDKGYKFTENNILRIEEEDYYEDSDSDFDPERDVELTLESLDESWD